MSIFIPDRPPPHLPPPTSLAPATAPASQSIGWVAARTEPAIVEARKEDGLRGLSLTP